MHILFPKKDSPKRQNPFSESSTLKSAIYYSERESHLRFTSAARPGSLRFAFQAHSGQASHPAFCFKPNSMNNELFLPQKTLSGRPGSNRRHSAWKADALPTELLPRFNSKFKI